MPMHDWTRVSAGIYHDFHNAWITELRNSLNDGRLPPEYYALGEQRAGDIGPDVLALHAADNAESDDTRFQSTVESNGGMVAVAEAPPKVSMTQEADEDAFYLMRQRSIVIRHSSGDRIVAMIEIVSPANKHSERTVEIFVSKIASALAAGIHVMLIDPLPPGIHDPCGMHGAVWDYLMSASYDAPDGRALTLASYAVQPPARAYIEPTCVGRSLIDMPLFLKPEHYIPVPLEETYMLAWSGVPQRWRRVIEGERPPE
jgi:hypothetical protein